MTSPSKIGTANLRFSSCTQGRLDYAFSDGSGRQGSIPLARLLPNVTCATGGTAPLDADFALSGNWYVPAQSGQGVYAEVNPNAGTAFVAWYTYGPAGGATDVSGQRWYSAQGTFAPGARTLPMTVYETTGGRFDAITDPPSATCAVGTATLGFADCGAATLEYAFTGGSSAGAHGLLKLSRVGPVPRGCGVKGSAEGYWSGTSNGRDFRIIVLGSGDYYIVFQDFARDSGVIHGSAANGDGRFSSTDGQEFVVRPHGHADYK